MRCSQCGGNAMYEFQGHNLCLSCYSKVMNIIFSQQQESAKTINYLHDRMDEMMGVQSTARIPIPQPIISTGNYNTQNNIHVDRSVIGVINTGQIQSLNQRLDNISNNTDPELAESLKNFTEKMLENDKISETEKQQLLEELSFIAEQLTLIKDKKPSIVKQIVLSIGSTIQAVGSLATLWQVLCPEILKFFN